MVGLWIEMENVHHTLSQSQEEEIVCFYLIVKGGLLYVLQNLVFRINVNFYLMK